jgi:hypothetical protein
MSALWPEPSQSPWQPCESTSGNVLLSIAMLLRVPVCSAKRPISLTPIVYNFSRLPTQIPLGELSYQGLLAGLQPLSNSTMISTRVSRGPAGRAVEVRSILALGRRAESIPLKILR